MILSRVCRRLAVSSSLFPRLNPNFSLLNERPRYFFSNEQDKKSENKSPKGQGLNSREISCADVY